MCVQIVTKQAGYVSGDCDAGFWCISGSASATPNDGVTGSLCPQGRYCTIGIAVPDQCPTGTWSNSTGLMTAAECQACSGGYYCNSTGLTEPSGPCAAGYYCTSNSSTPTPNDGGITGAPCTVGHYCPEGTPVPIPCSDGTYMSQTGAAACWACTAGYYCTALNTPVLCPPGYYCPEGTGLVWQSCPAGTFSMDTGLANATQCTQCLGGYYCSEKNATAITGPCAAGYYCTSGSDMSMPDVGFTGIAGPCTPGHYCRQQTSTPSPCPTGTFSNDTHLLDSSNCTLCSYGTYCGNTGLTQPSATCWAGFYCLNGAQSPNNPTEDSTGGPCSIGHYCPNGTALPLGCPAGTYNPTTGMSQCSSCPTGYYCLENSTHYSGTPCPTGHYCPLGTESPYEYPCPEGYYNNQTQKGMLSDCLACDAGSFCNTSGLSMVSGACAPGWYCSRAAWSDKPADIGNVTVSDTCLCAANGTGGKCQPGEYCPAGSSAPTPCTTGESVLF